MIMVSVAGLSIFTVEPRMPDHTAVAVMDCGLVS
jgi:hypothetical protein